MLNLDTEAFVGLALHRVRQTGTRWSHNSVWLRSAINMIEFSAEAWMGKWVHTRLSVLTKSLLKFLHSHRVRWNMSHCEWNLKERDAQQVQHRLKYSIACFHQCYVASQYWKAFFLFILQMYGIVSVLRNCVLGVLCRSLKNLQLKEKISLWIADSEPFALTFMLCPHLRVCSAPYILMFAWI